MPRLFLLVAVFFVAIGGSDALAAEPRRPNILFIIADDQSPYDLKTYDPKSPLQTPVLDRLAAEGMVLDAAHHMGAFVGAVCTPSRHMVMSGRTVWHLPIGPGAKTHCPPDLAQNTMAAVFNRAGYATMRTCKVGNSYEGANQQFTVRKDATKRGGNDAEGSAWHAEQVLDYLKQREAMRDARPFLIYFGFSHPHDTRDGKPELLAKYGAVNHADKKSLPPANAAQPALPLNYLPAHPFPHGHPGLRDEVAVSGVWENRDERTIRNELGREFACSENIDIQIGRVLDRLKAMGELDNTYVFYTADHGIAIGRHGLQGKQNLYEHTWRVPFIVKGPGIQPGTRAKGNIYLLDVLATMCELTGVQPPDSNEGVSFRPVLEGKRQTVRDVLYGVYSGGTKPGMRCVKQGDWKLIKYDVMEGRVRETQLFNLAENPHEFVEQHRDAQVVALTGHTPEQHQRNLADDPRYAKKLQEMEDLLLAEMRRWDDPHRLWNQPADDRQPPSKPNPKQKPNKEKRKAAKKSQPNVVIFLADDAGWGDYGHSGNKQVSTPNIDSIAKGGVSLDRFYVCPVCAPTRAEFLTGRYHPRGGVRGVSTGQERLDLDEKTLADAFQHAGYATGAFGKWHNGSQWPYHPMARGFDEYFGHSSGHWGEYFDAPLEENGRMIRTQGYIVDVCTDRALQFIEKSKEQPFFCYVPFTTPHSPWAAPAKDWQRFQTQPITQRAANPEQEVLDETRCVLAMVENQDWNVGRVLTKLEELGLRENTIVLYFSDNGPNSTRWNGGMKGKKGTTEEGGVRSVCYLSWPAQLPAGRTVTRIAGAIDLLPTLTALAKVPRVGDKPLDGRDLSPLLFNQDVDWPDRMIYSTWAGRVSVRTQRHRLDDQGRLFDMREDPGQTSPINQGDPETAERLSAAVKSWRQEMFGGAERLAANAKLQGLKKAVGAAGGNAVDPRPIPVGYREFPVTMLPARDGEPRGGVRRSSAAPNCSYFVNWTGLNDSMVWLLDVHTTGRYEVVLDYTCPDSDAGALIELSFRDSRLSGRVNPGWDPPLYTNQDTLPRPHGESQMKEFRPLKLGVIDLEKGQAPLTLRALEIPGQSVMDVRRITLTLLE